MKQKLLILAAIVGLGATVTAFGDEVQMTVETPTVETFVHNLDSGRYQRVKKEHNKGFYVDKQTGERWRVGIHPAVADKGFKLDALSGRRCSFR
jgi:hypothetical protein